MERASSLRTAQHSGTRRAARRTAPSAAARARDLIDPAGWESPSPPRHRCARARGVRRGRRRAGIVLLALLLGGLVAFALTRLDLSHVGHALINAHPGWIVLALALMALSLVLRSVSWHETLRAALPRHRDPAGPRSCGRR